MADRILIKNGIVLTQDPISASCRAPTCSSTATRSPPSGPNLSADGAKVIDAAGDIVIPGFIDTHRHTWETSIRTCAPDYALITYFGSILDKFAPALPARRRLRGQPLGRPRVHQRGHHDARRLVAHHEHAGPRRRGDPGPPGVQASGRSSPTASATPRSSRLVVRAGLTGSVLTSDGPDARRSGSSTSTPTTVGSRCRSRPAARASASRTSSATTGSWRRSWDQHHGPCRDGPLRRRRRCRSSSLRDMDLLYPNTTYVHASHFTDEEWALRPGFRRQRLVRAPDRDPDGPRLGAGLDGDPSTACRSGCPRTSRPRRRPTSSPRCARSSARSAAASTGRRGTRTSTGTCRRRTSSPPARC